MGIVLQDVYRKQLVRVDKMMPATQMVFLELLYMDDDKSVRKSEIAIKRNYSRKKYYEKAKDYLINPIQKVVTIMGTEPTWSIWYAGESALSQMSQLNPPRLKEIASIFWKYIKEGGYKCGWKNAESMHFYRFTEGKYKVKVMVISKKNCIKNLTGKRATILCE